MATKKHDGQKLYEKFIDDFREAYPKLTKQIQYKKAQALWKEVKDDQEKL